MLSFVKTTSVALITLISLVFTQDVALTIDGQDLNYESLVDIYGFQFSHDGCAMGAGGGDAESSGFSTSCSAGVCVSFSLTGSSIAAGSGTLLDLGGDCDTLGDLIFSGQGGVSLEVEFKLNTTKL